MVEVRVRSAGGLRQEITAGVHSLAADEPVRLGGGDTAPNPYELLLAALGSCAAITVELFAQRRGWPLTGVEVNLRHERIHARDCADCGVREGYLDVIHKEITLRGSLSEEQVSLLGEIAEKCPVNQTLHRAVKTVQTVHHTA